MSPCKSFPKYWYSCLSSTLKQLKQGSRHYYEVLLECESSGDQVESRKCRLPFPRLRFGISLMMLRMWMMVKSYWKSRSQQMFFSLSLSLSQIRVMHTPPRHSPHHLILTNHSNSITYSTIASFLMSFCHRLYFYFVHQRLISDLVYSTFLIHIP